MNSQPNHQEDRLSSWKEIADYLDCKPRTCIRWEKNLGLPIHRLEGAPKSRIYAYKNELDAWLRTKLRNGAAPAKTSDESKPSRNARFWLIAIPIVLALAAGAFFLTRPKPEAPIAAASPPADGVPRSTDVFDMYPGDIITTEFLPEGKLRVWRKKNATTFFEAWRMAPLRHTSLALGDLDGDADVEIVAPAYCRDFTESGGQRSSRIRFFLNAYKRGVGNWWKTTFYDPRQCVYEQEDFEFTDIAVGNLDALPGNEVALVTAFGLSVYRYDPGEGNLKLVGSRTAFLDQAALHFRAVTLTDIDGDGAEEIIVLGNEWRNGIEVDNRGWLVVLNWTEGRLDVASAVAIDANVSAQSLRNGDVVPGGGWEIVFPIYRRTEAGTNIAVTGWNAAQGFVFEIPVGKDEEDPHRPIHVAVGDIMERSGDEVVVAKNDPNELVCCFWNGEQLVLGPRYVLAPKARLTGVSVSPARDPGNRLGRVVAFGSIKMPGQAGEFYLEAVDYGDGFVPVWLKAGGDETDIKVSYAAFGK